jgi:hypothetical protein
MKLKTFLNSPDELHAFIIGFFEVLCPWKPRYSMPLEYPSHLKGEYHYYLTGRGIGFTALLLIIIALCKLVEVLF